MQPHLHLVYGDDEVLKTIRKFQEIFHKKQCLIHSDIHTSSAMICKTDVKVTIVMIVRPIVFGSLKKNDASVV